MSDLSGKSPQNRITILPEAPRSAPQQLATQLAAQLQRWLGNAATSRIAEQSKGDEGQLAKPGACSSSTVMSTLYRFAVLQLALRSYSVGRLPSPLKNISRLYHRPCSGTHKCSSDLETQEIREGNSTPCV